MSQVNIRKLCSAIEEQISVRALSLEMEIVLEIFFEGPQSVSELLSKIHASQASFAIIARRLLQQGVMVASQAKEDRRRTIYSISPQCRKKIEECISLDRSAASAFPQLGQDNLNAA